MTLDAMAAQQLKPFRYEIECCMEGERDWIPLIGATSAQDALDQIAFLTSMDQKHQPAHVYSYRVVDNSQGFLAQEAIPRRLDSRHRILCRTT